MFQNPQDELAQNVSKKMLFGRIIFSSGSSESYRVFNYLQNKNSIFRARRIIQKGLRAARYLYGHPVSAQNFQRKNITGVSTRRWVKNMSKCLANRTHDLFPFFVPECVHGATGWTQIEVPEGWTQIVRGRRPPTVKWPVSEMKGDAQFVSRFNTSEEVPHSEQAIGGPSPSDIAGVGAR